MVYFNSLAYGMLVASILIAEYHTLIFSKTDQYHSKYLVFILSLRY